MLEGGLTLTEGETTESNQSKKMCAKFDGLSEEDLTLKSGPKRDWVGEIGH